MNYAIAFLKSFIFLVSSSMLYPVLFFLVLLMCWIVMQAGALFYDWIARRRAGRISVISVIQGIKRDGRHIVLTPEVRSYMNDLIKVTGREKEGGLPEGYPGDLVAGALLEERIQRVNKSLDLLKVVIRVGPGLGLIGTLIPMGTGLSALGQGDIARLSSDLVVAFTTTVVGMFEGLMAYFFFTIRKRWVEQDTMYMELVTELLAGEAGSMARDSGVQTEEGKAS